MVIGELPYGASIDANTMGGYVFNNQRVALFEK